MLARSSWPCRLPAGGGGRPRKVAASGEVIHWQCGLKRYWLGVSTTKMAWSKEAGAEVTRRQRTLPAPLATMELRSVPVWGGDCKRDQVTRTRAWTSSAAAFATNGLMRAWRLCGALVLQRGRKMIFFFASVFHFLSQNALFRHNRFYTLFFSMKVAGSSKIVLVSTLSILKRYKFDKSCSA